jgi:hypothetical protein
MYGWPDIDRMPPPWGETASVATLKRMTTEIRELDQRTNDGLDVRLLWDPGEDRVTVAVTDHRNGEDFEIEVGPGDRPLDVFHHPFAYRRRVLEPQA